MVPMKSWFRDIERAATPDDIVASARDYVSLWSPRELPDECREIHIADERDIPRLRERLALGSVAMAGRQGADRFRDLVAYMARASERLGELKRDGP